MIPTLAHPNQLWHVPCRCVGVRILIYQNPDAGHERPRPDTLIESLQREGHDVEWRHIKQHRLSDPDTGPLDLVVAVGGDGSVGRTARQLIGGDLPIAVLPMGTANNLATVLDAGAHDLAERIAAWRLVPFDAGTLEGCGEPDWFFEGLGVGAFADTAARLTKEARTAPPQPSREAELARDLRELTQAVRVQRPVEVEVAVDGRTIHAHLLLLEILNIARLGPGVQLADGHRPFRRVPRRGPHRGIAPGATGRVSGSAAGGPWRTNALSRHPDDQRPREGRGAASVYTSTAGAKRCVRPST